MMKKQIKSLFLFLIVLTLALAACTQQEAAPQEDQVVDAAPEGTASEPEELIVMTHDSFAVSEEVVLAFETENNVKITFIKAGDTGASLNRAVLTKDAPIADVLYGVDNTFLSRALTEEIFEPYDSPLLAEIADEFKLDPNNGALPIDYGDVCINYDKALVNEENLPIPTSLESLTDEIYRDKLVVENPATSSPGLAFLMATIAHFGEDGYLEYWEALRDNGVLVVNDWESAYYSNFTTYVGEDGGRPLVVSYASSPAVEVVFATEELEEAPTAPLLAPGTCFRQIEFAGILKGTEKRELAEKWIDFMLSTEFQEDIPMQMFVFPINGQAELPEVFIRFSSIAEDPATLDPDLISEKRDEWIQAWDETVLR